MTLIPGTKLGRYEVLAPLGAGGMGEVYRARDTKLGRDVAVKVLPEHLASDRAALARFQSEARAVAALSHPNILAIFDAGEADDVPYAVTELLDGQTLRSTVERGPLGVRRALEIAEQIAVALAAAHENGIVHRDVKPENVFLTRDGQVKVLDFGLARRPVPVSPTDQTLSVAAAQPTEPGVVFGTVAYMSPEQARGETVDFRSDQFSLGVVLYELLTGARPFVRDSTAETLTAIIRDEPEPLEKRAPHVPAPVRWLVERLLAKEPAVRYDSTRDLARELATWSVHLSEASSAGPAAAARRPSTRLRLGAAGLLAGLVVATVVLTGLHLRERRLPHARPARFEIRLPEGQFLRPADRGIALSPDGRLLVYTALVRKEPGGDAEESTLMLRPLDSLESRPIHGTSSTASGNPVFSPDGSQIAFTDVVDGKQVLKAVPVGGGAVRTVCVCDARFGAEWAPDDTILFASELGPLKRVLAAGGTPEPVTTLDTAASEVSHRLPSLLPDGRAVVYTALRWRTKGGATWRKARLFAQRPGDRERHLLVEGGSDGRWAPPGVLLFAREGKLLAAPLDTDRLRLTRTPAPLLDGVRHLIRTASAGFEIGAAQTAVTAEGLLAWVPGSVEPPYVASRSWFDLAGRETPLEEARASGPILSSRISPDGRQVLLSYNYPGMQAEVVDLVRGGRRRVTFELDPKYAIWGPGPDRITFQSDHEGPPALFTRRPGAGPEELQTLWKGTDVSVGLGSWSRDGKILAFVRLSPETNFDIFLLEPGKEPRPFLATRMGEGWVDISPDGRWILYGSWEPGRPDTAEVFVRTLSGRGDAFQVSVGGGLEPLWSRDGTEIYFRQYVGKPRFRQALFRVKVAKRAESLELGKPERLFEGEWVRAVPGHSWDVGPDGRFLLPPAPPEASHAWRWLALTNRIVVDTGGVARLMAVARPGT